MEAPGRPGHDYRRRPHRLPLRRREPGGAAMTPELKKAGRLEKSIGYVFKDRDLLTKALTHSSHAYETQPGSPEDNEQLEFLGDSVIGLITAEFFLAAFPGRNEGEL